MTDRGPGETKLQAEVAGLREQLAELRARLREPEEIIRAIRQGEVDAVVVNDRRGDRVYSLRSADLLYRGMIEEMKDGAVALDSSGLIVYANAYFARLVQRDRKGLIGSTLIPHFVDDSRPFFEGLGTVAVGQTRRRELVLRASDGSLAPVHATMNRISLDDGDVYCVIVTDLTGERHREQLLTESRRKDEFLAMLAHELRNPVAPIRNAALAIKLGKHGDSQVSWAADVIDRQVSQLSRLIDDLMDVSRVTRGQIRLDAGPVDLTKAIAAGLETVQPTIQARHQELVPLLPPSPVMVHGDAARLAQVVSNVVHNAAKFTPEGGRILVALEHDGGEARIVVRDNGIGIRAEMLPRIFDLFTQADSSLERSPGGLGIGLALVRTLVEMQHGRVEARSDGPGRGSEFVVTLPLLAEEAARDAAHGRDIAPGTGARPGQAGRRILVVDDNVDAAESLMAVLNELGHDVRMVTEGKRVIDVARGFQPEAVLLDISLPDISGYDLASELRRSPAFERVCLVALTGYAQEEHRRRSREVGFDYHCVKPLDLATLDRIIDGLDAPR
jgi:PAS domain S-box-containing protein